MKKKNQKFKQRRTGFKVSLQTSYRFCFNFDLFEKSSVFLIDFHLTHKRNVYHSMNSDHAIPFPWEYFPGSEKMGTPFNDWPQCYKHLQFSFLSLVKFIMV